MSDLKKYICPFCDHTLIDQKLAALHLESHFLSIVITNKYWDDLR
jgi:hypothetical protein